jgi:hypothetical protein
MVNTVSGLCRIGQADTADSLTIGSSRKGAMVSSVMQGQGGSPSLEGSAGVEARAPAR